MKTKTVFYCTECGNETGKWAGRCSACGSWNTIVEAPAVQNNKQSPLRNSAVRMNRPKPVTQLDDEAEIRFHTGLSELDRVLGGGAVRGSICIKRSMCADHPMRRLCFGRLLIYYRDHK